VSKKLSSGIIRLQNISEEKLSDARQLRQKMTLAEKELWQQLRNRKLEGYKFRRQQIVQGFIADFYCEKAKLALEIDGGIHLEKGQIEIDIHREKVFSDRGIKTLRIQNNDVIDDLASTLSKIKQACQDRV